MSSYSYFFIYLFFDTSNLQQYWDPIHPPSNSKRRRNKTVQHKFEVFFFQILISLNYTIFIVGSD